MADIICNYISAVSPIYSDKIISIPTLVAEKYSDKVIKYYFCIKIVTKLATLIHILSHCIEIGGGVQ